MTHPLTQLLSNRAQVLRIIGTVLAIALLVYLLSQQSWQEIEAAIRNITPWRLFLAMVLMIVSRFAVSGRWYVLLRSTEMEITPGVTARITFAGLFANNFLPTTIGGDVIRLAGAIQFGYNAAICTASLIVDRLIGMAGMAMSLPFGLPSLLAVPGLSARFFSKSSIIVSGLSALPFGRLWQTAIQRAVQILKKLFNALAIWLKQPRALLFALAFTWVHMLCFFGIIYIILGGLGEYAPFWLVAGLYSFVYFVTLIPISINGYGVQELILTYIFSQFAGTTWANGLITALLFRTLQMVASLPGALFVPGIMAGIKDKSTPVSLIRSQE